MPPLAFSGLAFWLGLLALAGWAVLALSGFWTCRERDDLAPLSVPASWPEVVAVVPARNEADVIATSLASLAAQDYPGPFRIILVDDNNMPIVRLLAWATLKGRQEILEYARLNYEDEERADDYLYNGARS